MALSVEHISETVSKFCVPCDLETPAVVAFFDFFIFLHPTMTNVLIYWRELLRFIILHCKGMETSLSCDYAIIGFLSVFIPYMNISYHVTKLEILSPYFKFHMG